MSALLLKWFGREVRRFCHTFCICNSFLQVFARILVCILKCIFINYFVSISACGHQSIALQLQKKVSWRKLLKVHLRFIMFSAPAGCRLRRWDPGVSWSPGTGTVWTPRCRSFSELWKASSGAAFEVSESPRRAEMNLSWLWLLTCHCLAAKLLFYHLHTFISLCIFLHLPDGVKERQQQNTHNHVKIIYRLFLQSPENKEITYINRHCGRKRIT